MNKSEIIDFFIVGTMLSIGTIFIIGLVVACVVCGLFEIIGLAGLFEIIQRI